MMEGDIVAQRTCRSTQDHAGATLRGVQRQVAQFGLKRRLTHPQLMSLEVLLYRDYVVWDIRTADHGHWLRSEQPGATLGDADA